MTYKTIYKYFLSILFLFTTFLNYAVNLNTETKEPDSKFNFLQSASEIIKSTPSGRELNSYQIRAISDIISKAAKNQKVLSFLVNNEGHWKPFLIDKAVFDSMKTPSERNEFFSKQIDLLNKVGFEWQRILLNGFRRAICQDEAWKEIIGGKIATIKLFAIMNINYRNAKSAFDEIKSDPDLTRENASRLLYLIYYSNRN